MYGTVIERSLSADGQGYIFWKGVEVEHYRDPFAEQAKPRLSALADRCEFIESLGFKPTGSLAVSRWEVVKGLTPESPFLDLIANGFYEACVKEDEDAVLISFHYPAGEVEAVIGADGQRTFYPADDWYYNDSYHRRRAKGWKKVEIGQPEGCGVWDSRAEDLIQFLQAHSVPADLHQQARQAYELLFVGHVNLPIGGAA